MEKYKKYSYYAGLVLAVFVIVFVGVKIAEGIKAFGYIGQGTYPATTVSFTGDGEVLVKPDIGTFTFTVSKESKTVAEATEYVNDKVKKILDALDVFGIEEKDLKTYNYSLNPRYDYVTVDCTSYAGCKTGKQVFRGYEMTQTIQVKVRNIDKVGGALDVVTKAGATDVGGLSLSVENMDSAMAEAREEAIREAKAKAEELAESLGVKLVRIVSFGEYGNNPVYYDRYGMGGAEMAKSSMPAPTIPTGENKIISNVTITYEIR